jgi:hypothetical protein
MKRKKPQFDTVKVVKNNARERVGQPSTSFPIESKKQKVKNKRIKTVKPEEAE